MLHLCTIVPPHSVSQYDIDCHIMCQLGPDVSALSIIIDERFFVSCKSQIGLMAVLLRDLHQSYITVRKLLCAFLILCSDPLWFYMSRA